MLTSLLIVGLISGAPLTAATFVGARMGYKGLALIVPWIGAVALGMLVGFGMASLGSVEVTPSQPATVNMAANAWIVAMLVSGYLTTLAYLIVLAARRLPARPADAAAVF